jgi:Leucine-rich repeat (LRR) protein
LLQAQESVHFADANLKAVVEEILEIADPAPDDMLRLVLLDAQDKGISDLTGLEHAVNLQTLNLKRNRISDVSPISQLGDLEYLRLGENQIVDLSPLSKLTNLRELYIENNLIVDVSPLSGLTDLERLYLENNQINDIAPLSGLSSLKWLYINNNQVSDLSPLSRLMTLERLIFQNNLISDLSPLSGLTGIRTLNFCDNYISDISVLSALTDMQGLYLENNQISDISSLSGLTDLRWLNLSENQITDISPLSDLTKLRGLHLWDNQINDISPISRLFELETLDMSVNRITDISALSGLVNLEFLLLDGNQIRDIFPLTGMINLSVLNLLDNPLVPEYCYVYIERIRLNNPEILLFNDQYVLLPNTLYVDGTLSDPLEDGTPGHPFDSIQKAVDTAEDGCTIFVYPCIYSEQINFSGKALTIQGVASSAGIPVLENQDNYAVAFENSEGPDSILKNFVIRNSFMAVFIDDCSPTISNLTIVDNQYDIGPYDSAQPDISNCIIWRNTYNNVFQIEARYSCIETIDYGEGNLGLDPLFADPDNGDYHLLSEHGRYSPQHYAWILDEITSTCIDTGDPNVGPLDEPAPNGGRTNMGAFGGTSFASMSQPDPDEPIYFIDENLKIAVEEQLGISDPTPNDMLTLISLHADDRGITNLAGLEYAENLQELYLRRNQQITDISALDGLVDLEYLFLGLTQVSDISPLTSLTKLRDLRLWNTRINDISALSGLINLRTLFLDGNQLTDISALAGLTNLVNLRLYRNQISDISALADMIDLDWLLLDNNNISDISPLTGLKNLSYLNLQSNPLNRQTCDIYIPRIIENNPEIEILYDPCTN